jgi:hypothetical protein
VQAELADARPDAALAADAVRLVPAIFGGDGPCHWLVAFVTPVEARGRTGFMGNFAELTAVDGQVDMTRFGRSSELEAGGTPGIDRTISGPQDYVDRWGRFAPAATWRNITMSPDFPAVGQVMAELYPQSGGEQVDGVIAVDPIGLAALMTFTGPVPVEGLAQPLTADTAAPFLLRDQYTALPDTGDRVDALESLARGTFDRLTSGDLPGPRQLADALSAVVAGGHLHAYATDPAQQRLFAAIGVDGAMADLHGGDGLGVVTNNATGNKVDLFLHRDVAYDATWDPATGDVSAAATVTLTNGAPGAGLPGSVIGSPLPAAIRPPPGTNRTYLSIYTPWVLDRALVDGAPVAIERQREADRYAYSLFLDVPPGGGTRTVTLELRGQVADPDAYRLALSSQPLVDPDAVSVSVQVAGDRPLRAHGPLGLDGRTATASAQVAQDTTVYRIDARAGG